MISALGYESYFLAVVFVTKTLYALLSGKN